MNVEGGKTIIARGKIEINGDFEVLGARINKFITKKFTPIYCKSTCEIDIDGDWFIVDGYTIPQSWKRVANKEWETLFIYGGIDTGKSTLATYLANIRGGCYVLDLDIGQSDIAHPGAMGYGYVKNQPCLNNAKMINGFFVGHISPSGHESKCLRGVSRLWRELETLDGEKIIDTTGWVKGKKAKEYKLAKIEIIQPDLIVSFERKPSFLKGFKVMEIERGLVVERDRIERSKIRSEIYKDWLSGAKRIGLKLDEVDIKSDLLDGEEIPKQFLEDVLGCKIEFVLKSSDQLTIFLNASCSPEKSIIRGLKELYNVDRLYVLQKKDITNLALGLYKGKKYRGLALLKDIDKEKIVLETKFQEFDIIEFGSFRIEGEKEYITPF